VRVLVTGAAGFIGSSVVRELVARGHRVDALVRPGGSPDRLDGVSGRVSIHRVDLSSADEVEAVLARTGPDAVVHLAWIACPGTYLHDIAGNLSSLENSIRLIRLLAAGPTSRLVIAGTCLEGSGPVAAPGPEPIYAITKRAFHQVAAGLGPGSLSVACAHIFSVYGPGEDRRRAVPSVIGSLIRGRSVDVGTGLERRDYVHVDDVASALVAVLESDLGGGVDVCTGDPRTLRAVFEAIGRATDAGHLIGWGARPVGAEPGFGDAVGDPAALAAIGWHPRHTFAEGIDATVAWWRAQQLSAVALP